MLPSVVAWSFSCAFLLPKAQVIWAEAGLTTSKVRWLMETVNVFMSAPLFLLAGCGVLLLIAEFWWREFARYRPIVLTAVILLIHTFVLAGIVGLSLVALLAGPMLGVRK